jgi:hypothetical protein
LTDSRHGYAVLFSDPLGKIVLKAADPREAVRKAAFVHEDLVLDQYDVEVTSTSMQDSLRFTLIRDGVAWKIVQRN